VEAVHLWPTPPLPVADRSFFAGDELTLELTLVDRHSGEPRLTKVVHAEVDPRNAQAVKAVVDRALAEAQGWVQPGAAWPDGA
jgi:hypothetical protein